jgi:uncharacterized protein YjbJ (UPF0337 family)
MRRSLAMKDKIKGKAEEVKGKVTGDKVEELKGRARQQVGSVKQTVKEIRHDAEHRNDGTKNRATSTDGTTRSDTREPR